MTHPTPIPESLADTLAALARIKAGDGSAPGLDPRHLQWLRHDPTGSRAGPQAYWSCDNPRDALAHLLDVCMGVMEYLDTKHDWMTSMYHAALGYEIDVTDHNGEVVAQVFHAKSRLGVYIEVVCAIADVVGEKEGVGDGA